MSSRRIKNGFVALILMLMGLGLVCYPFISEYLFENRADSIISTYIEFSKDISDDENEELLSLAGAYNEELRTAHVSLTDPFISEENIHDVDYDCLLDINGTGMMGYLEIPQINLYLPIYHGTSAGVLDKGVGHLEGSSLPIGGEGTHAVLTGHTGVNQAKLFTDLTELIEGDVFYIHVLGDTLAYKVYMIEVVLPSETDSLGIVDDVDIVTLITCTPYGINSHRLLVHAIRTEYIEEDYETLVNNGSIGTTSRWLSSYKKALLIGMILLFVFAVIFVVFANFKKYLFSNKR